jgi:hypothetical protein
MEQIVQPFQGRDVGPEPYGPLTGQPNVPALVKIGLTGGTQTFTGNFSYTQTNKLGAVHTEAPSSSGVIQHVIENPQSKPKA